jgi:hypothetical protein
MTSTELHASRAAPLVGDLELFSLASEVPPTGGCASGRRVLGFGPIGGLHPIWGIFRLSSSGSCDERKMLWRVRPGRAELERFCSRSLGAYLAAELVALVGDLDSFYVAYFSARPDLDDGGAAVARQPGVGAR